jgi:lipoprotein NlpD
MKFVHRIGMLFVMPRYVPHAVALCAALLLAACGTMRSSVLIEPAAGAGQPATAAHAQVPGGVYTVRTGDTLYSIAFRNAVDFRDLAQWNQIATPYTIWPGQRLRLSPPVRSATPSVATVVPAPTGAARPASPAGAAARPSAPAAANGLFETVPAPSAPTSTGVATTSSAAEHAAPAPHPAAPPVSSPTGATSSVPVAGVAPVSPSPADVKAAAAPVPKAAMRTAGGLTWRWPADGNVVKRFQSDAAIPGIEIAGNAGAAVRAAADGVVVYSGNGLVGYGELVIIKHSDSLLSAYAHNAKRLVKDGQRVSAGQQIATMGSSGAANTGLGFQIRKDGNPVDPLDYLPAR